MHHAARILRGKKTRERSQSYFEAARSEEVGTSKDMRQGLRRARSEDGTKVSGWSSSSTFFGGGIHVGVGELTAY